MGNFLCNLSYIFCRKFPAWFALSFLTNLCNNLSYILYRKFPTICFALPFLANLFNNLSYTLQRKFPTHFASVFSGYFEPHICSICIQEISYIMYWTKCCFNWLKNMWKNLNYFFPNGASYSINYVIVMLESLFHLREFRPAVLFCS